MTPPETAAERAGGVGPLDRSGAERTDPALLDTLRDDPATRVLVVRGDGAPLAAEGGLALLSVREVPDDAVWAFLGRLADGAALLLAALDPDDAEFTATGSWGSLRVVGGELPDDDAGVFVLGVALARWLRDSAFCPACGTRTELRNGGWSRLCPSCGREHFPRTDPAVIVAVERADDPDKLLLGSNALWGADRYSCFAGFVEAGESLEDTIVRELQEEAGVVVTDLRYAGSQGWPYPRSLMLGFHATAAVPDDARGDGDEIVEVRWFTRDEIGAGLAGTGGVTLPGPASIARRLIRQWYEGHA